MAGTSVPVTFQQDKQSPAEQPKSIRVENYGHNNDRYTP
jgi:hypothetical protein